MKTFPLKFFICLFASFEDDHFLFRGFPGDTAGGRSDGNIGIAHTHFQRFGIVGHEAECGLLVITGPDDGDQLTAIGIVTGTAGMEGRFGIDVVFVDTGLQNQHIVECLHFAGNLVMHELQILVILIFFGVVITP